MIILAERESSQFSISIWNEYLVLTTGANKSLMLFTGRFEALAEIGDYYNEETEDYDLPDEIDGKSIQGIEDEYVVGGEPQWLDESQTVEFDDPNDPRLIEWLKESEWAKKASLPLINSGIEKIRG
jgi:hypothetical protein